MSKQRSSMRATNCAALLIATLAFAAPAFAQTPINAPGAMQPSTGTGVYHVMPTYRRTGADPIGDQVRAHEYILLNQIAYGLSYNFSLQLDVPLVFRDVRLGPDGRSEDDFNIADSTLLAKWRLWQHDPAPAETTRFSLIGGLQIPGNSDYTMDASHGEWNPIVGSVFSMVRERHGFNASLLYELHTGSSGEMDQFSDSLRYDASYLFRFAPREYADITTGAWYAVAELNGFYDINGDHELFVSPGLMYEARTFTLDASVMIPVHQDLDFRAETDFIVGAGVRISF